MFYWKRGTYTSKYFRKDQFYCVNTTNIINRPIHSHFFTIKVYSHYIKLYIWGCPQRSRTFVTSRHARCFVDPLSRNSEDRKLRSSHTYVIRKLRMLKECTYTRTYSWWLSSWHIWILLLISVLQLSFCSLAFVIFRNQKEQQQNIRR